MRQITLHAACESVEIAGLHTSVVLRSGALQLQGFLPVGFLEPG